jgi:hypothetical protein
MDCQGLGVRPLLNGTFQFKNPRTFALPTSTQDCVLDDNGISCFDKYKRSFANYPYFGALNSLVKPEQIQSFLIRTHTNGWTTTCLNYKEDDGVLKFVCLGSVDLSFPNPIRRLGKIVRANFDDKMFYYEKDGKFYKEYFGDPNRPITTYDDCKIESGVVNCPNLTTASYATNVYLMSEFVDVYDKRQAIIVDDVKGVMTLNGDQIDIRGN